MLLGETSLKFKLWIYKTNEGRNIKDESHYLYFSYWYIRQFNNIDFSSEVSTVHKFVYTDEAFLLVRE